MKNLVNIIIQIDGTSLSSVKTTSLFSNYPYRLGIPIRYFFFPLQYRGQASKVGPRVGLGSPPLHRNATMIYSLWRFFYQLKLCIYSLNNFMMKRYFSILSLKETASLLEVKKAYKMLAKKYHPDRNSGSKESTEQFKNIQEAYEKILAYLASEAGKIKHNQGSPNLENEPNSSNNKSRSYGSNMKDNYKRKNKFEKESEENFQNRAVFYSKKIGENINLGYFEYTVLKSEYLKTVGGKYSKIEADGIYLIIELRVLNKTNILRKLHNYMLRLSNQSEDYFEFSSKGLAALVVGGIKSIDIFGKELNPKISATVNLIFEVPNQDNYYLHLCGGEYSWDENTICHCKEIEIVKIT